MKTSRWILTLTLFWTDRLVVSGHWSVGETKGNFASRVFLIGTYSIVPNKRIGLNKRIEAKNPSKLISV